jgi:hypothetical protein
MLKLGILLLLSCIFLANAAKPFIRICGDNSTMIMLKKGAEKVNASDYFMVLEGSRCNLSFKEDGDWEINMVRIS